MIGKLNLYNLNGPQQPFPPPLRIFMWTGKVLNSQISCHTWMLMNHSSVLLLRLKFSCIHIRDNIKWNVTRLGKGKQQRKHKRKFFFVIFSQCYRNYNLCFQLVQSTPHNKQQKKIPCIFVLFPLRTFTRFTCLERKIPLK